VRNLLKKIWKPVGVALCGGAILVFLAFLSLRYAVDWIVPNREELSGR